MIFRFAELSDYAEVNRLARQVHELHVGWRPDIFRSVDFPIEKEHYCRLVEDGHILLGEQENVVTAYAVFSVQELALSNLVPRTVLKLEELCVDEAFRRRGIARAMMERLFQIGREAGCTDVQLTCDPHNAAGIAFYESLGMKPKTIQYHIRLI